LLDPAVIDKIVLAFRGGDYDYVSNAIEPTYPDGLDTEVFRFSALEKAWKEATQVSDREHVTPYIAEQPKMFKLANIKNEKDLSSLRWTVDWPQDLEFLRRVYGYLDPEAAFGMAEVITLLNDHPELREINKGIERNETYQEPVRE
jgi:spore coat polysaccharide biosynthesis protein SpsF